MLHEALILGLKQAWIVRGTIKIEENASKWDRNYTGASGKIVFKTRIKGDNTRDVGNLFQDFRTRTENAPILRRRRLSPWSNR